MKEESWINDNQALLSSTFLLYTYRPLLVTKQGSTTTFQLVTSLQGAQKTKVE
jgi:hypothetical protein